MNKSDIEKSKQLLFEGDYTCVMCRGDVIYTSQEKGISPVLNLLENKIQIKGFSVADKIVGKAAAMLFVYGGIKEVYANVMSQSAIKMFKKYGMPFSYKIQTDQIMNREGTGICPMENCVNRVTDIEMAFTLLQLKRQELRGFVQ